MSWHRQPSFFIRCSVAVEFIKIFSPSTERRRDFGTLCHTIILLCLFKRRHCLPARDTSIFKKKYLYLFTFLSRQHETRQEWECEGYIRIVLHTLDVFLSHLEVLGKMSVNQSRVKRNENVSTLSRSSRTRVWMSTFVRTSSHSPLKVSTSVFDKSVNPA